MLPKVAIVIALASLPFEKGLAAPPATLGDCVAACSAKTPDCLSVSPPSGSGLSTSFAKLYSVILKGDGTITATDLGAMFGGITDPCGRSATTFGAGVLSNSGQSCLLTQQIEFPGTSVAAEVLIPQLLQVHYTTVPGEVQMVATGRSHSAMLMIGNKFLNADWGGSITSISFRPSYSVLLTENGGSIACLQFNYGS